MDTRYTYNPLPYNIVDKNNDVNRQAVLPSYQYKKRRVIWLNTNYATSKINNGTTYYQFTFDVPPFQLYNQTSLKIISFTSNEDVAKPLIIKITNLLYDVSTIYCNDKEGYPILFINHIKAIGSLLNDKNCITLVPQLINSITIKVNNSFTARDSGFTIAANGTGHFIIGLSFEDDDLIADNIVSQYK
jgi:hypothetical protein